MKDYFADLHIHIGRARGNIVKVTGSPSLTFENILNESINNKGLDIIGIVDCCSPLVIWEIEQLINTNKVKELTTGGLLYNDKLTILLGAEIEIYVNNKGAAHCLCYFPFVNQIKMFSEVMSKYIKNINLSCQKSTCSLIELMEIVDKLRGVFIPAHVFTPYKSFYGKVCRRLTDIIPLDLFNKINGVELGLSADASYANNINELKGKTYLSNSD